MHSQTGLHYFLNGFKLILKPGIKRFVVIPLLLNVLLITGLFWVANHYVNEATQWLVSFLPHWLQWLGKILWLLFLITFLLVLAYTYVMLANLVSAPFNSLLAERVALYLTGKPLPETSVWGVIKDTPRMLARQFEIIGYYLPRALGISILSFIPVLQFIATPLWILFNSSYMALQYVDFPTDNERVPLRTVRERLKTQRWLSLSFGGSVLVASMVPLLNLLAMPAAVAGATELWLKEYK
jgi:CysZ protein